jgi:hypothetical protein
MTVPAQAAMRRCPLQPNFLFAHKAEVAVVASTPLFAASDLSEVRIVW